MLKYNNGVFIGRFQPFHSSHLAVVQQMLKECNNIIIVIGSYKSSTNVKNPFTYSDRVDMILSCLSHDDAERLQIVGVRDYFYNENMWIAEVQSKVNALIGDDPSVALYGSYKDESSYYIKLFPQWKFEPSKTKTTMNATDIRYAMFANPIYDGFKDKEVGPWFSNVPSEVKRWIYENYFDKCLGIDEYKFTDKFLKLQEEYKFLVEYKKKWASAPYPPTFVTTDAVVIKSGHVLVVKRKFSPGKDLIALPGGFLNQEEFIVDGMLRELKEETRIKIDKVVLKNHIRGSKIFDYPERSLRGRIITHAYHIDLGDGELPEVKGSDDASGAFWMPIADAIQSEEKFFEDHWHIVYNFVMQDRCK